ncbi:hypothetical protein J4405_02130 [Candidatus Woesearchaeota archaeon]|nr:hypothetical protein [Candidatus Woesearchaeota archaeon]
MDPDKNRKYRIKRRVIIGICVFILIVLYLFKNASFFIRALSAMSLLVSFYLIDRYFDLNYQKHHYFFIVFIAFFGFILSPFYYLYPNYDKILHFIQPIFYASIVYHMVKRLDLEYKWKIIFVLFIVIGSLALFEIGEYLLDYFFDLKLQGVFLRNLQGLGKFDMVIEKLDDTMWDLSIGFIGTLSYVVYNLFNKANLNERKKHY